MDAFKDIDGKPAAEVWKTVEEKAKEGALSTKNMRAKKGRARYLGDKSVGYVDAGSMSMYYFIRQIAEEETK